MKRFADLTIRIKLISSFLTVALLAGVVGIVGLMHIRSMQQSSTEMYQNMTVPLSQLADVSETFQRVRINLRDMVFAENETEMQRFADTVRVLTEELDEISNAYAENILSAEMQAAYQRFVDARRAFAAPRDRVMQLAFRRQDAEAVALLNGAAFDAAQAEMDAIEALETMKVRHARERQEANAASAQAALLTVGLILLLALGIALGLGIYLSRIIGNPLERLANAAQQVADGDYDVSIDQHTKDELGSLAASFNQMVDNIRSAVSEALERGAEAQQAADEAAEARQQAQEQQRDLAAGVDLILSKMTRFADGDLTVHLDTRREDAIGQLFQGFNRAAQNLRDMLRQVDAAVAETASASSEISATSDQLAASTQEQSSQADEVAAAVEQMTRTIIENSTSTQAASDVAEKSGRQAQDGGVVVQQTVDKIREIAEVVGTSADRVQRLGSSSKQIGEIVETISDIADQTNLLALNAAIEAARAGEQGRGFAVVADEVRKLAERTTSATQEIAAMIKQVQTETDAAVTAMQDGTERVDEGLRLADQTGQALEEIVGSTGLISQRVAQIAAASEEQSATSEQISQSVHAISSVSQDSAVGVSQIARSASGLEHLTTDLRALIDRFQLSETGAHAAPLHSRRRQSPTGDGSAHPAVPVLE